MRDGKVGMLAVSQIVDRVVDQTPLLYATYIRPKFNELHC